MLLIMISAQIIFRIGFSVSWSENIFRLTDYPYFDGFPVVTQTSDGRIWVVWSKDIEGNLTLFYKTSFDFGNTWSKEDNLTKELGPGQNVDPAILQVANGTIWVVWASNKPTPPPPPEPDFTLDASPQNLTIPLGDSDNSTIIVTSLNNFSDPVDLFVKNEPLGVTTTLDPSQVTPPPNGTANSTLTIYVATTAKPGNYTMSVIGSSGDKSHKVDIYLEITESTTTTSSDTSLSIEEETSTTSSSSSSLEEDYEVYYKVSHDNGATWSVDFQLTNNSVDDFSPSFTQLKNGTIMVVWQSTREGNTDIYYKTTIDGSSWSKEIRLTTHSGLDKGPSIMQAKDGKIWVVWASDRTGNFDLFYKTYDGSVWSDAAQLTYSSDSDASPSILQTVDEIIWVFWSSYPTTTGTATGDIYYKYSIDNGATWSDRVQFTTDKYEDVWPAITQAHDIKIWVVWTSNRGDQPDGNWDVYYRTSLPADINEDGVVDIKDLSIVSKAFGTFKNEPDYNPDADVNKDGVVDLADLTIVAYDLGAT
jgi:hypothetical protein